MNIASIIDLERHPIHEPGSTGYETVLSRLQTDLTERGCAVLKGFIKSDAMDALIAEGDRTKDHAHASHNRTNAYFSKPDEGLPDTHPINRFYDRSNAFIPADNFDQESPLRAIYEWPEFMPFIRKALGETADNFYRYDDPLADVIINMVEEGDGFPWHFDTNNYTVTLAIQNGQSGGHFEYAPWIRTSDSENFGDVQDVLDGTSDRVETLILEPGDLQIFKGRYALHRVTPVRGNRRRYVGIFSFVDTPGMCGSPERTRQLYGRVLPHHLDRAGNRSDALID